MMQLMTLAVWALAAAAPSADPVAAAGDPPATAAQAEQKPKVASSKTRYCVMLEPTTGSRIGGRECRTKAEWERIGVDIANMK